QERASRNGQSVAHAARRRRTSLTPTLFFSPPHGMYSMGDVGEGGPAPMFRGVLIGVTFYDAAEPDPGVESVTIGTHDGTEIALQRGPDGWALERALLVPWRERAYAPWPEALRAGRARIQERLATP